LSALKARNRGEHRSGRRDCIGKTSAKRYTRRRAALVVNTTSLVRPQRVARNGFQRRCRGSKLDETADTKMIAKPQDAATVIFLDYFGSPGSVDGVVPKWPEY